MEREAARNVERMRLTGRLTPDFKTIADFGKDNGAAIRSACRQFVALCRGLNLFPHAIVAIDGSRFKACNSRDRSFSHGLDKARHGAGRGEHRALSVGAGDGGPSGRRVGGGQVGAAEGQDRLGSRERMRKLKALDVAVRAAPDQQISLTDPDAGSMATSGKDAGMVGYNVQAVVDAKHPLIVARAVANIGNDRSQLSTMAKQAQEATGVRETDGETPSAATAKARRSWPVRRRA